ncbi:hypothetical protein YC2023_088873 [Brassica napus]
MLDWSGSGDMASPELSALRENVGAFMNALLLAKPAGLKKSNKSIPQAYTFPVTTYTLLGLLYSRNRQKTSAFTSPLLSVFSCKCVK